MRTTCIHVVLATCVVIVKSSLPLPNYIRPCARSDSKFNECAKKHAQDVIAYKGILNGDPKYRVPPLNPLEIPEIKVAPNGGLAFTVKHAKIYGVDGVNVEKIHFDFGKKHVSFSFKFPTIMLTGNYEVKGRVLLLPIVGKGDVNMTLVTTTITYDNDFTLRTVQGKQFVVMGKPKAKAYPSRMYIHLTNLFNGDKLLGEQMNTFLNENWEILNTEFSPAITEAFTDTIQTIVNNVATLVPFEVAFPETIR